MGSARATAQRGTSAAAGSHGRAGRRRQGDGRRQADTRDGRRPDGIRSSCRRPRRRGPTVPNRTTGPAARLDGTTPRPREVPGVLTARAPAEATLRPKLKVTYADVHREGRAGHRRRRLAGRRRTRARHRRGRGRRVGRRSRGEGGVPGRRRREDDGHHGAVPDAWATTAAADGSRDVTIRATDDAANIPRAGYHGHGRTTRHRPPSRSRADQPVRGRPQGRRARAASGGSTRRAGRRGRQPRATAARTLSGTYLLLPARPADRRRGHRRAAPTTATTRRRVAVRPPSAGRGGTRCRAEAMAN